MEISDVRMGLQQAEGGRFMAVEGNDRVAMAVIVQSIQNGLRIRKYRFIKLKTIGMRMKIHRGVVAESVEIERKVILGLKPAERLVHRADGAGILHRRGGHGLIRIRPNILTGAGRVVDDCAARAAHAPDQISIICEVQSANVAREMNDGSVRTIGDGQRIGGRVELLAEAHREVIDVREIDLV